MSSKILNELLLKFGDVKSRFVRVFFTEKIVTKALGDEQQVQSEQKYF